jgi:hypothetical protein
VINSVLSSPSPFCKEQYNMKVSGPAGKLAMISSWFSLPSIRTENTPNPEVPKAV